MSKEPHVAKLNQAPHVSSTQMGLEITFLSRKLDAHFDVVQVIAMLELTPSHVGCFIAALSEDHARKAPGSQ